MIAHPEDGAEKESRPSHGVMREIIAFAKDFCLMIHKVFLGARLSMEDDINNLSLSLSRCLNRLDIKNIKHEFDK